MTQCGISFEGKSKQSNEGVSSNEREGEVREEKEASGEVGGKRHAWEITLMGRANYK